LTPARPWVAGTYALVASTIVEDLAGNQIGTPFEVTERGAVPDARSSSREAGARARGGPHGETVSIPFEIR
jgi:hypothetical protein